MRRIFLVLAAAAFFGGDALAQRGGGGGGGRGGPPGGGGGRGGGPPPGVGRGGGPPANINRGGLPAGQVYRGNFPGNAARVGPPLPATSYNIGGSPRPGLAYPSNFGYGGVGRPYYPGNFGYGGYNRGFNGSSFAIGLGVGSALGYGFGGGWAPYSALGLGGFGRGFGYGGYGGWGGYGRGYTLGTVYQPTYVLSSPTVIAEPAVVTPSYDAYSVPATTPAPQVAPAATDYLAQADALVKAGRYTEAVSAYQHAAVDQPQNPQLPLKAARALAAAGQYDQAAGAAQQALAMLPSEQWLDAVRNSALELPSATEASAVLTRLRAAADAQGAGPGAKFLSGLLAAGRGDKAQAQADLNAVVAASPQDEVAKKLAELVK